MDLRLAPFSSADLEEIVILDRITKSTDWSSGLFEAELAAPHRINLVARVGDRLVGFIFSACAAGELGILAIAVDPAFQRQGIGRRMITELITFAKNARCDRIFLEVRSQNVTGRAFYRGCGFEEVGVRKNYYPEPRPDDAVQLLMPVY